MGAIKTLAFVIKTQDYRDTSLLATFYTREMGKLKAVVKGARDGRYRYGSTLEPFSLNEILVHRRRRGDLHLVTGAEVLECYGSIRADLGRLGLAVYLLELIDQLIDDGEPHPEVFSLLEETLHYLGTREDTSLVCRIFEIGLIGHLGLMPELGRCVRCGSPSTEPFYFSVPSGGVFCGPCRRRGGEYAFLVPKGVFDFIDRARTEKFAMLSSAAIEHAILGKVEKVLRSFIDFHLHHKPRSLVFLEKIKSAEKVGEPEAL